MVYQIRCSLSLLAVHQKDSKESGLCYQMGCFAELRLIKYFYTTLLLPGNNNGNCVGNCKGATAGNYNGVGTNDGEGHGNNNGNCVGR